MNWHRTCKKPDNIEVRTMDDGISYLDVENNDYPFFKLVLKVTHCPFCGVKLETT
ncbi:MAG TPA: hypothetical protein VFX18_06245 [Candidatus Nitrosocosmicus sp.]|nr:hypothetical protein [Candidatus Nitrosocosmicus sp.]